MVSRVQASMLTSNLKEIQASMSLFVKQNKNIIKEHDNLLKRKAKPLRSPHNNLELKMKEGNQQGLS